MASYSFEPIGIIETPFNTKDGMPIQSIGAEGIKGKIILNEELVPGLKDLDGFSHIILIYIFHRSEGFELLTIPFLDDEKHGVFSTRAPRRPNQIGMSVVKLLSITKNIIEFENADMMNGTPLLDIKPYISAFDVHKSDKNGWLDKDEESSVGKKSDNRFG